MKKRSLLLGLTAALTVASAAALGGCSVQSVQYENAHLYTVGETTIDQEVRSLDIGWLAGGVEIVLHDENTVVVEEEAARDLEASETVRYYLDGSTLRVRFCEAGKWRLKSLPEKTLTVKLPRALVLHTLAVETVSADLNADGLAAERLEVDTVSGKADIQNASVTEYADLDTTSGDITLALTSDIKEISVDTTSGKTRVSALSVEAFSVDTTSGGVQLTARTALKAADIDSTSGNIVLYLPANAAFSLEFETVSGDFESDFATVKSGESYICGENGYEYSVESVSADVTVKKIVE
ncbi:MAG: DUF4097 family beta strand repeat protein [Clostridia bacterium]|nr:DUF4097 family beta strand repeat protein [Clostridia bacterium]